MKVKVDRVEEWVRLYRPEIVNEHESERGNDKKMKVDRVKEWVRLHRPASENKHESESGNDKK